MAARPPGPPPGPPGPGRCTGGCAPSVRAPLVPTTAAGASRASAARRRRRGERMAEDGDGWSAPAVPHGTARGDGRAHDGVVDRFCAGHRGLDARCRTIRCRSGFTTPRT
jgi:hypothetical protein